MDSKRNDKKHNSPLQKITPAFLAERIEVVPVARLVENTRNARRHPKAQVAQIARSIEAFGFTVPLLVDEADVLIAGHGRLQAARLIGLDQVPIIRLSHLSADAKRALMLADNKIALGATWDVDMLASELQLVLDSSFSVDLTGFGPAEVDLVLTTAADKARDPDPDEDVLAIVPSGRPVSLPGDLWIAGDHRVLVGSALDGGTYDRLLGGEQAAVIVTDPPYNLRVNGQVGGRGKIKHREFVMGSGEMDRDGFTRFLGRAFDGMAAHTAPGAVAYVFGDWRHLTEYLSAAAEPFGDPIQLVVWDKVHPGQGVWYRQQHELVFVFRTPGAQHLNTVEAGRWGRSRSNIWRYPGMAGFGKDRRETLSLHPTPKPVQLVADAIRDASKRGGLVLDPFLGSGTTLLAAEKVGRRAAGIELDPVYVDVTIRRWQRATGRDARHADTGATFDETAAERGDVASRHETAAHEEMTQ